MFFKPESRRQEGKLAAEQDLHFAIRNRRNKLLGLWAAGQSGRTGDDAETYAREIVRIGIAAPSDPAVVERITADLAAAGRAVSAAAVSDEMERLEGVAALEYGQPTPPSQSAV